MSLSDLITEVFVWVDDCLQSLLVDPLRSRGPLPTLADSEVITLELVGEWLGLDTDVQLFGHFRQYHADLFPLLGAVDRSTFARQAANLWQVKQQLHRQLVIRLTDPKEPWLVDSITLPVCRFARATFCQRFRGQAGYGHDQTLRQTFYGFRLHFRSSRDGIILAFELAAANEADTALVEELLPPPGSVGVGDRNYWSPALQQALAARDIRLLAPFRTKKHDPNPDHSRQLSRVRWTIETMLSQWTERFQGKRTWARDLWHLCHRVIRKVLSHTIAVWLCRRHGLPTLQFSQLLHT